MPVAISADRTQIAHSTTGTGPPVVLVDGAMCHRTLGPARKLVPLMSEEFTVVSYDRRGRGESGNSQPYSVEREIEDLAAVLTATGGQAMVLGMSSGAALAVRAVAAGLPVTGLALFEPPYVAADGSGARPPADAHEVVTDLIAQGAHGEAVKYFPLRVYEMPRPAVAMFGLFRTLWNRTKETAPSLPHDLAIMADWLPPNDVLGDLDLPVLVICGEKSPAKLRSAYLEVCGANSRFTGRELRGQGHNVSARTLAHVAAEFFARVASDLNEGHR